MGTGMMDQFSAIKAEHPDTVLFFRMGDFYELFHDDARIASEVLGLTLTTRDKKSADPIPMAGFPWHALETHVRTMLSSGRRVTVVEQEKDIRPGRKILERVVTRVFTPGSIHESSLIGEDGEAILLAIVVDRGRIGCARIDLSCGTAMLSEHAGDSRWATLADEVLAAHPAEILVPSAQADLEEILGIVGMIDGCMLSTHGARVVRDPYAVIESSIRGLKMDPLEIDAHPMAAKSLALVADYISHLHRGHPLELGDVQIQGVDGRMRIDRTSLRNLEIIRTTLGEEEGSLAKRIDRTKTWMGRRCLREWLVHPLTDLEQISFRQDGISHFIQHPRRLSELRDLLKGMRDLERLSTKLAYGHTGPRDMTGIADGLERLPRMLAVLGNNAPEILTAIRHDLDALGELSELIRSRIEDDPSHTIGDGNVIRHGIVPELDDLRSMRSEGRAWFAAFETRERERIGVPSLKVRQNRAFGWFIEITKKHIEKVPEEYRRRQTLTNAERYVTEELQERQETLLSAEQRIRDLEMESYDELLCISRASSQTLARAGREIARVDALASLAEVSRHGDWSRPNLDNSSKIDLLAAKHPVLEENGDFVPNDLKMDGKKRIILITGPNMGGKSTYLRQAALIVLLAQIGSYVPAKKAKIGIVDAMYTRIGAHDDLRRGRSTFMVEMLDVAHILRRASPRSLILLDEIGRGTSTFDGLAIAWSVLEWIGEEIGARTLVTTHYHQLVGLEGQLKGLVNRHVEIREVDGELRFLHSVSDGPCDRSYGVQVAALAGLSSALVDRASDLLDFLERNAERARAGEKSVPSLRDSGQYSLWSAPSKPREKIDPSARKVLERLREIDPDLLSPRDALDEIFLLRRLLDPAATLGVLDHEADKSTEGIA